MLQLDIRGGNQANHTISNQKDILYLNEIIQNSVSTNTMYFVVRNFLANLWERYCLALCKNQFIYLISTLINTETLLHVL
jgi:predicted adenine nucleotide alpha hydrolase (AANH) superfamily ATPase